MKLSRRDFMRSAASISGAAILSRPAVSQAEENSSMPTQEDIRGAIVLCNHWSQFGIGYMFPSGELRGRWYRQNFSSVFGFEQGRLWLEANPTNRICHEYDAFFLDSLAAEDPEYLGVLRNLLDRKLMELPGGTYGQAESQVFGYESAIRQLTYGQAAYQRHLNRAVDTFIVEEQNFFPQLPQLLKLAGFKYASMQFQNSGTPDALPYDLILWEALDGSALPAVPNHPGMQSCARQWKSYDEILAQLPQHKAPLLFQWLEIWPPGLDWGASLAPYTEAIRGLEKKGFRQMLLTEYIQWALPRIETPRIRIAMDQSNYNNNFFQGGWGYENERTARGSNHCENLLLAAETLCAGGHARPVEKNLRDQLPDLWSRLLVSQNHDPYLAGSVPAYVDGLRSFQSELAIQQLSIIRDTFRDKGNMGGAITLGNKPCRLFNPCPWDVETPVLLELHQTVWPQHAYELTGLGSTRTISAAFRSETGNILAGPVLLPMTPYGTRDLLLIPSSGGAPQEKSTASLLVSSNNGHCWESPQETFAGVIFEPLAGEWRQVPSYFNSMHPNTNIETAHTRIEEAPITLPWQCVSDGMDVAAWREDLMRIRDVENPAMSVEGLVYSGKTPVPFIQFNHRLNSVIRFETGARPGGTWRFRIRIKNVEPQIFADAPFSEERRATEHFYCSRYIRLEWPGRHILWCPSQNTLFRRIREGDTTIIECTVLDFSFMGSTSWEMRFYSESSFSPAESMRLAETFQRKPIRIPSTATAGRASGFLADHPDILITHVFQAKRGALASRMLNASNAPVKAQLQYTYGFSRVAIADLNGQPIPDAWNQSGADQYRWEYVFRPWEIATFFVK